MPVAAYPARVVEHSRGLFFTEHEESLDRAYNEVHRAIDLATADIKRLFSVYVDGVEFMIDQVADQGGALPLFSPARSFVR